MPIGSCTLANMRLSLVSGTAFVDFSAADTLTPYLNGKLTLTDSAGKKAIGYLKAAGTGETLGDALNTSNCVNSAALPYNTFDGVSATGFHVVNTDASAKAAGTADQLPLVSGVLFKKTFTITLTSGTAPAISYREALGGGSIYGGAIWNSAAGANTRYSCINGTTTGVVQFQNAAAAEWAVSNLSVTQVLTPSATGVTITSTAGGTTYNWASIESGFNYNDSSGYTYNISLSNEVLYEDNNILILNFKDCPVTNATQILVDVSDYNCNKLSIEKIWHSISGIATAILFDATTDDTAIILGGNDVWTFDTEFPNPKSTGFTGDLNMTISSAAAGDSYNIILKCRKY